MIYCKKWSAPDPKPFLDGFLHEELAFILPFTPFLSDSWLITLGGDCDA